MFELHDEPLFIGDNPNPWKAAVIPWDTETFGFRVSALKPCPETAAQGYDAASLKAAIEEYAAANDVCLMTASIAAQDVRTSCLLQRAGFRTVDMALCVRYPDLRTPVENRSGRLCLYPAGPSEWQTLVEMAGVSFRHGRYHMDPCFPAALADQRYRDWLRRCLEPGSPQQLLTAAVNRQVCGFSVVECRGAAGYLHLHAIGSGWQGKRLGQEMILKSLDYLHNLGAGNVDTKISASNLRAINLHSRLNAVFTAAESLLHWHRDT